jgi:hypothetical protein
LPAFGDGDLALDDAGLDAGEGAQVGPVGEAFEDWL